MYGFLFNDTNQEKKPYLEKVLELKAKYGKAVENANAECEEVCTSLLWIYVD